MISSLDILYILSDIENYERFSPHIKEHLVGNEAWTIIQDMSDYYEKHSVIDWEQFSQWFLLVKHSIFNPSKAEIYKRIFEKLSTYTPDEAIEDDLIEHFVTKDYATKIAETSLAIVEGSADYEMEDVSALMLDFDTELNRSVDLEEIVIDDPMEILKSVSVKTGLEWRLPELNEALGKINKGDFLVFASYSGAGKTTMLANEAWNFAKQLPDDKYVLWFNNEERGEKVRARIMSSITNMSHEEAESAPLSWKERYESSGVSGKIIVKDAGVIFTNEVDRLIKKYPPGLIIIDQLYKIHGFSKKSENEVTRLGMIYNWGRELAKLHAPVIATHQADGSAAGQLYVEMNQLHMSKVALQGEMDAVVTIGKSLAPGYENVRGLYTPKNKLTGKESFKAEILIDPERARYRSP